MVTAEVTERQAHPRRDKANASYYGPYRFVVVFDEKEQANLKVVADSIVDINGARICFRKPGWKDTVCLESGNVTAFLACNKRGLQDRELKKLKECQ